MSREFGAFIRSVIWTIACPIGLGCAPSAGAVGPGHAMAEDVVPIGHVQGVVSDDVEGATFVSPLQGRSVTIRGIVSQKLRLPRGGGALHGFFVQNAATDADEDSRSSDGIYVFLGRSDRLRDANGGFEEVEAGDEIVLRGRVDEYYYMTQIVQPTLVRRIRRSLDLDRLLPPVELAPPADAAEAARSFERLEGMRVTVPKASVVTGARKSFDEIVLASPKRRFADDDPYARRVFRDPHPFDNRPDERFDDGNGDRIYVGALGLQAGAGPGSDPAETSPGSGLALPPARTFDELVEPVTGGLYFSYGRYQVQVETAPRFARGPDPSSNHAPGRPRRPDEILVAVYNVENLYDHRNDPTDPNDFASDPGRGVRKPFNYLPADEAEYRARLSELAEQILTDLHAPEILMLQEVEDQDILAQDGDRLVRRDGGDGRPDSLQELAQEIARQGGPSYEASFDRRGADVRGIICAFLHRPDRVRLAAPKGDPLLDGTVPLEGLVFAGSEGPANPRAIDFARPDVDDPDGEGVGSTVYSRAAQVARFDVRVEGGASLYLVNNHFSSRPADRVEQRVLQARAAAAIASALLEASPDAWLAVGGDLNVYPRPDDPFPSGHPSHPSDQLAALYEAGLSNLYDRMLAEAPAAAYTYVYEGQAQTLDQLFVSKGLSSRVVEVRAVHVNCDWPADEPDDGPRGASDHDPLLVRIRVR